MTDIPGLFYIPDFIDDTEYDELTNILTELNYNHVGRKNSRVSAQYGYKYNYNRGKPGVTDPIIDILDEIVTKERLCPWLTLDKKFDQLIVNKYEVSQSISAHIDHVKYFGPVIACVSIGGSAIAKFTDIYGISKSLTLEDRSLYIMSGDSRYKYTHEISKPKSLRYSLTYRTMNER